MSSSSSLAPDSARLSLKRARDLFDRSAQAAFLPSVDNNVHEMAIARRLRTQYNQQNVVAEYQMKNKNSGAMVVSTVGDGDDEEQVKKSSSNTQSSTAGVLARLQEQQEAELNKPKGILVAANKNKQTNIPTPNWHAPWKLSTVLSSHLGWVRSIAMDPTNEMFATGGADRVIKVWDLAKASVGAPDALKITLTGHISPVRGLAFSDRHPYLFSAGEDKQIKCWDLETNQVIRHYHGHLSGIFALSLHPTLDVLVTGGRDAVARVWDMRTKTQVHVLGGHDHTIASILTKGTDPQIITGSHDTTIKMWDLAAGKCFTTLTQHMKSIRALAQPSFEHTFTSGAADCLKKWQGKDGRFIRSNRGHNAVVNALAVNDDGVLVSGGDDGSLNFWDYETGHCFQKTSTVAQPGSLEAENGIYATAFDLTGSRLITCEADKTVKIWKQDEETSDETNPIDMAAWRKQCIAESKMRY